MKNCDIVKDLLPLYAEKLASEESSAFIQEHLEECADCRAALDALKTPVKQPDPAAPLRTVRRTVKKRGWLIAGLIACLVAALFIAVIARLLKPIPIHSAEEVFDTVTVDMPKRGTQIVQGDDVELPWSTEEMEAFSSDRREDAFFSVTQESYVLTVEPDGGILWEKDDNSDLCFSLNAQFPELNAENGFSFDQLDQLAKEQGWIILRAAEPAKDGRTYPVLIIPDRAVVRMRVRNGITLQIEYRGKVYNDSEPIEASWVENGRQNQNGGNDNSMTICAYTTALQQIMMRLGLEKGVTRTTSFTVNRDDLDAVFFEPYNNTERETLYLREGYTPEAGYALPRLVMNYYFLIALAGTVILGIVWLVLLLTKKRKARRVFDVLLIIAGSFTLAFLAAGFPATTIAPGRELIFVCVIALLLIGAGLCGRGLLRKE